MLRPGIAGQPEERYGTASSGVAVTSPLPARAPAAGVGATAPGKFEDELRTSLTLLLGFAELMAERELAVDEVQRCAAIIHLHGSRILAALMAAAEPAEGSEPAGPEPPPEAPARARLDAIGRELAERRLEQHIVDERAQVHQFLERVMDFRRVAGDGAGGRRTPRNAGRPGSRAAAHRRAPGGGNGRPSQRGARPPRGAAAARSRAWPRGA